MRARGYNTTNPPCTLAQFGEAVKKFRLTAAQFQFKYGDEPVMPELTIIETLTGRFDHWMKNKSSILFMRRHNFERHTNFFITTPKRHNSSDIEELLDWLRCDYSPTRDYLKNYDQFCQLAKAITEKGYNIDAIIPEEDFNQAIESVTQAISMAKRKKNAYVQSHSFFRSGEGVQSARTVAFLDSPEGSQRPCGAKMFMNQT